MSEPVENLRQTRKTLESVLWNEMASRLSPEDRAKAMTAFDPSLHDLDIYTDKDGRMHLDIKPIR
jgi:hypothetical protein